MQNDIYHDLDPILTRFDRENIEIFIRIHNKLAGNFLPNYARSSGSSALLQGIRSRKEVNYRLPPICTTLP